MPRKASPACSIAFVSVFLAALPVFAQNDRAQDDAPNDSGLTQKLSQKIEESVKQSGVASVSVAVVKDGKLVFSQGFGKASVDPDRPATVDTRYAVGSISKEFTAAALLYAQEQGKLSLEDKVAKYFPDLTRAHDITIRQLLSHVSGYEDYAPQDYIIPEWTAPTSAGAVVDRWAGKPLNFDPGTDWQYSNTNFVLAAMIFEKATGQKLLDFLQQKIFGPLEMTSAGYCNTRSPNDASPYTRFGGGPPRLTPREAAGWYFGAAELCMTASDLARWDMAFLSKKILSSRSYEEFTREAWLANGNATHYALGLSLGEFNRIPTVYHGGEVSGFLASNVMFPTRHSAVIVLSNEDGINFITPLSLQISAMVLLPDDPPALEKDTQQVRDILTGLSAGKLNRSLFTDNANSYFRTVAMEDLRESLSALGELKSVTRTSESSRGGMIHRSYRAEYAKRAVILNIYVMPDGRYEQFIVEE